MISSTGNASSILPSSQVLLLCSTAFDDVGTVACASWENAAATFNTLSSLAEAGVD